MTDMNLADIAAVTNKDMYSKKATMIKYLHSML